MLIHEGQAGPVAIRLAALDQNLPTTLAMRREAVRRRPEPHVPDAHRRLVGRLRRWEHHDPGASLVGLPGCNGNYDNGGGVDVQK